MAISGWDMRSYPYYADAVPMAKEAKRTGQALAGDLRQGARRTSRKVDQREQWQSRRESGAKDNSRALIVSSGQQSKQGYRNMIVGVVEWWRRGSVLKWAGARWWEKKEGGDSKVWSLDSPVQRVGSWRAPVAPGAEDDTSPIMTTEQKRQKFWILGRYEKSPPGPRLKKTGRGPCVSRSQASRRVFCCLIEFLVSFDEGWNEMKQKTALAGRVLVDKVP